MSGKPNPWTEESAKLLEELKTLPYLKNRKVWDELFDIYNQYIDDGGSDPKTIWLLEKFIQKKFEPTAKPLSKLTIETLEWLHKNLEKLTKMKNAGQPSHWIASHEDKIRLKLKYLIPAKNISSPVVVDEIKSLLDKFLIESSELQCEIDWIWVRINQIARGMGINERLHHTVVLEAFRTLFTSGVKYNFLLSEGEKHKFLKQKIEWIRKGEDDRLNSKKNKGFELSIHDKTVEAQVSEKQLEGTLERFLTEREVKDGKKSRR